MLWSKQYYYFDLDRWLKEHQAHPLLGGAGRGVRNAEWFHMLNGDVISMPDKWEYPWYAAWDLAFHTIALSLVDFDFAKEQLLLMLRSLYSHPNGQMPAYEWNFSDVNPPVHAWATLFLYKFEKNLGREDIKFLERSFQGLMLNFNWWVNRKDPQGRNVFAGGFLGLDNIGVFDRSAQLPTGGSLEQADGTAWMAFYGQCMLEMALVLAEHDPVYEEIAFKFLENVIWITYAMDKVGEHRDDMWDEEDGFYYDVLRLPSGEAFRLKVRSMVGLLPLCASTVFEQDMVTRHPRLMELIALFKKRHPEVIAHVAPTVDGYIGHAGRRLLSPLTKAKLERILGYLLDENEFLSAYGIRALSRYHREHPFVFHVAGQEHRVEYLPGDSNSGMFGGNSNWRGPIWMPVNVLIVRGLLNLYAFYGDDFKVECPTGSGNRMTLFEVAKEISRRLVEHLPARRERPPAGPRRHGEVPGGPALARPHPLLRVLPRRQRGRHRGQPPDRLDRPRRAPARPLRTRDGRRTPWRLPGRSSRPAWSASRWAARTSARTTHSGGAMPTPRYPALFQVNTRVRLSELAAALGRKATLDDIPDAELDRLAADGFDLVWFLGVWQTGEAARRVSRSKPEWLAEYHRVLPDFREEDVTGSCFAVRDYRVHEDFGGDEALARLRWRLKRRGLRLILDFVPNHMAPDHPWVTEHPDFFVSGTEEQLAAQPQNYCRVGNGPGRARPGVRARPLLRRLAGHAPAELRQPGPPGGDARRAAAHRAPVRRRPLRHGDARPAGGLRADLGDLRPAVLAPGDGGRPRQGPGLPLPRRGLLGPRVDPPAAGLRLHLRQAALRPPGGGPRPPGPRAPLRGPRLPGPPGPLPREPRRAAGRGHVRARGAPRPPPSSPSSRRAFASSTRASARASGCASPSTSAAGRTRPPTPGSPPSTTASWSA